jgi:hypothetical protein
MPNNQTHIIRFDGSYFYYTDNNGNFVRIPAISGKIDSQNSQLQDALDKGPLPEGFYDVKQSEYQNLNEITNWDYIEGIFGRGTWPSFLSPENSWGNERVWLQPQQGTDTYGRTNFSIHGGWAPESAGCIDLVNNASTFFDFFKSLGSDAVLQVDYGSGYDGSSNPLTLGNTNITIENIYSNQGKDLNELKPLQNFLSASKAALEEQLQMSIPDQSLDKIIKNYSFTESSNLQSFFTKYNLNTNLADYSASTPSFVVSDGNGNNFNLAALPNFSDLTGEAKQNAQSQFTTNFFDAAFLTFDYDVEQFGGFLDSSQISIAGFQAEAAQSLGLDSARFSTSFDSYFENSFLENLGLNQNLFDAQINTTDGQFGEFNFELNFEEPSFAGDGELDYFEDSNRETVDVQLGNGNLEDALLDLGYKNIDHLESDRSWMTMEYDRITNNLMNDLQLEQSQFIDGFNDDLQKFIADNPTTSQEEIESFAQEYNLSWSDMIDNLTSYWQSDVDALIDEYENITYFDLDSLDYEYFDGTLYENSDRFDWQFDPISFDGETLFGFGYYKQDDVARMDEMGDFGQYWEEFDYNSDEQIDYSEYCEDWDYFTYWYSNFNRLT